jgi:hypothetical protein
LIFFLQLSGTLVFEGVSSLNEIASAAFKRVRQDGTTDFEVRGSFHPPSSIQPQTLSALWLMSLVRQANDDSMSALLRTDLAPADWLPPAPAPSLHTYHWHFSDFRVVVGSNVDVYSAPGHPAVSLRSHPAGTLWEPCTALGKSAPLKNLNPSPFGWAHRIVCSFFTGRFFAGLPWCRIR